uniref:EF-hand domain-containing protein n=1 Tax=Bicosoecida sp. CB-2014 TaxID=1486930 RepID=A0A7S1CF03_9STRA|mmetsp:Transcript_24549/g.85341  ORF Transcript_24549/g.85341 Transcript_24549/m.85341 type:complete len:558 (+) Transcript_24549:134-1807(+)
MQFTPQQLSGGPKYNSKVKIGNWAEDRSRVEAEAKDYELKKSRGELLTGALERSTAVGLQSVPHSFSEDGGLHYGFSVQLRADLVNETEDTRSFWLANNLFERVGHSWDVVLASASPSSKPVARNVFVISRPTKPRGLAAVESKGEEDDTLCYGDAFYLASNPSLRLDQRTGMVAAPYYLTVEEAGAGGAGAGSRGPTVVMSIKGGPGCEWKVVAADGDTLATDGTPVPANAAVALVHCTTNQRLAASLADAMPTDFGDELGVHCFTYKGTGRKAPGAPLPAAIPNRWTILTATTREAAIDNRDLKPLSPEVLLQKIREVILKRGSHSIRGLGRAFRIMDDRRDGKLDREDFKWGLHDYGVHLKDDEFDMVLDFFDRDGDGNVSMTEFLRALRGEMNARREGFVREAYRRLDKDGSGEVTLSDLVRVYDTSFHPEVKSGRITHEEAVTEFMSQWDTLEKDGVVTYAEFLDYYKDLSASIDDDDYWELMMRNAWHISGGEGWAENTSCRRVLVVHSDDSQEVVEIKDDLGVADDDIAEMMRRLKLQGVTDIKRISLAD